MTVVRRCVVTSGQLGLVPPPAESAVRSGVGTVLSCSATADIDIYTSQTGLTTEDVPPSQQLIFQTPITGGQREVGVGGETAGVVLMS